MQDNLILLPHDPSILIQDLSQKIHYLNIMKNLMEHSLIAINRFQNQNLKRFDAQVGDTLCQIRAYKIHCLATQDFEKISLDLNQLNSRIHQIIPIITAHQVELENYLATPKNQRPDWIRASITLQDLFSQFDSLVPLSDDALFIVLSHILCHFHKVDGEHIPMSVDVRHVASEWNLSQGYAKKLTHYFQKTLANASCSFMFQMLSELPKLNQLQSIFPLLHRAGDEGRMVLPCHAVTEIIVHHMIQSEAHAVLIMKINTPQKQKTMTFHFKGNPNLNEFVMVNNTFIPDELPCMVFYGVAEHQEIPNYQEIRNAIQHMGLSHIVLTNNAAHPQYSGSTLAAFRENPYAMLLIENNQLCSIETAQIMQLSEQLKELQLKAHFWGLTQSNASTFFLKHIFCSTMDEYPHSVHKKMPGTAIERISPHIQVLPEASLRMA
ncbi:hypothetical protein [Legionella pneumophila]|uniref:hypothetical protein n=1 Tax=Legionella pneumophila TaxID=446 RepID=UPI0007709BE5|nr:hypothetical protein [Legionella pneumophila]CZP46356.1 Uncharacterised protein [Legionella pneumophila]